MTRPASDPPHSSQRSNSTNLIQGSGEMASLFRTKDWSATALGPMEGWSETLLSTVNLLLLSPYSFALYWGEAYTLLYNDTYRPFLGEKHPAALGARGAKVWPEAWPIIGGPIQDAFERGLVTQSADVHIPVLIGGELQERYWDYCFYPVYEQGEIRGIANIGHDSTPSVFARRELEASEEQLSQVLNATSDAVASCDRTWTITYLNPKAQALYSADREILGMNLWEAFPEAAADASPIAESYDRAMNKGIPGNFETFYPDPLNLWIRLEVYPTPDGIVTFSRDVSEQKRTNDKLIQTEKLAAVGRLAASIAHEINNPLESVTNLLYLARQAEQPQEIQEYLDVAERELRRVSAISNQTLRFYKQTTRPVLVTCQDLFESVLLIYHGRIVNSQLVVEKRKRAVRPLECFDGEIRQVLNNLVGNAIDATPPAGGRLILRSREATHWKTGREGLILTVADTGSGMPPAVLARVFEAFYTTKDIGGTGLGLWVSKEIVDRHQGELRVRSSQKADASGTVFTLFLPFDAVRR